MSRVLAVVLLAGCAHAPLSRGSLEATRSVAIVSRIADEAGPHSTVFRDDSTYRAELDKRRIDSKEADRRLALVLARGSFQKDADGSRRLIAHTVSRFELGDTLRSQLLEKLPRRAPWTKSLNPGDVARVLESFLVQEVPANLPDYELLVPLGADTVVEIVIEDYGMRSDHGRPGAYLVGFARMFRIGGGEVYHRRFAAADALSELEALDPFAVGKDATKFGERLKALMAGVTSLLADDLTPPAGQ